MVIKDLSKCGFFILRKYGTPRYVTNDWHEAEWWSEANHEHDYLVYESFNRYLKRDKSKSPGGDELENVLTAIEITLKCSLSKATDAAQWLKRIGEFEKDGGNN